MLLDPNITYISLQQLTEVRRKSAMKILEFSGHFKITMMMIMMMTVTEVKLTFYLSQDKLQEDEDVQAASEASILTQYQKDAQSFAEPQTTVLG